MKRFELAPRAVRDIQDIWEFVSEDRVSTADRLLEEFEATFARLAGTPGMGHKRQDLTNRDVLFWAMYSYLIVYKPVRPLRVVRVLHAKRHLKKILG